MDALLALENVTKTYQMDGVAVDALRGVSLQVRPGEFIAIMGPSGSGKSTFMNILGLLDRPTAGRYFFEGRDVATLDDVALARMRNRRLGFIFQSFNLLPRMRAFDNVALPLVYAGSRDQARAVEALRLVGLADRMHHLPNQLSGGQQQRVAIARALVLQPAVILADEPTGNLDTKTSHEIMTLLAELNEQGITIVLVTHERDIAAYAGRAVRFRDGRIERDEVNGHRVVAGVRS